MDSYWVKKQHVGILPSPHQHPLTPPPPLTIAVDTPEQCQLSAGAARRPVARDAAIQADQPPVVATGLVARHRLHQVGAVPGPPRRLIGDPPFPQFETCNDHEDWERELIYI